MHLRHRRGAVHASPNQKLPMLRIGGDSGIAIAESVAICRYLDEAVVPAVPASALPRLFGSISDPAQRARIEMWTRRVELELLHSAVTALWN